MKEVEAARAALFDEAAAYTDYLCVQVDEARLLVKTEDRHIGRATFTKQGRGDAKVLTRCVLAASGLAGSSAIEGRTFVDVGANIGSTTIPALLAHPFGAAVAFEPEPENFVTLRLNLVLNGLENRVTAVQAAASNVVGELDLLVDRSRSGKHSIANAARRRRGAAIKVPAVTLDSVVGDAADRVGLLWMDAEGHEGHILEGARELARSGVPIAFEWNPAALDRSEGRQKVEQIVGEHYTHFVDMRRYGEGEPDFQLRPVADLLEFERVGAKGTPHFTDVLVLRLTQRQIQNAGGSARALMHMTATSRKRRRAGLARSQAKRARLLVKSGRRRVKHGKIGLRRFVNKRNRRSYATSIAHVPARDELPALLNARNLLGRAAVIGLDTGEFSDHLLRTWRGEKLISVDPWPFDAEDGLLAGAKERLAAHGARSEVWQLSSADAAAAVVDGSLDFVYLEPREGERLDEDLAAWFAKVRPGGILAGDSYVEASPADGGFAVKRAVDRFFDARNIPVHSTDGPSAVELHPSWIVEIPPGRRLGRAESN